MIVKSILSAKGGDVISIEPTATLDSAVKTLAEHKIGALLVLGPDRRVIGILMERMTTGKFRHLPVIEDEQVIGVVSIGDVVKHRLQEIEHESAALRDYIQSA